MPANYRAKYAQHTEDVMDSEAKWFYVVLGIVIVGAAILACLAMLTSYEKTVAYIHNGYEQQMVVGNSEPIWVKIDK